MAQEKAPPSPSPSQALTLGWVRDALVRQEDSIVFALIERSRFPYNAPTYNPSLFPQLGGRSLVEVFVRGAESLQAKAGRYQNPEEVPFFPDDLPVPLITACNFPQVLHPTSAPVAVSDAIWNMYFNDLLPLITVEGDDGNYASTAASDLICLQVLSRRIHFGKFVAEVKYRDDPLDYTTAIHAKDRDALMKLLTFEAVEEAVKSRVKKKAMVFGQNVTLEDKDSDAPTQYKVDPSVVARLYEEWVIPFTKVVEVDYLLRRLDQPERHQGGRGCGHGRHGFPSFPSGSAGGRCGWALELGGCCWRRCWRRAEGVALRHDHHDELLPLLAGPRCAADEVVCP